MRELQQELRRLPQRLLVLADMAQRPADQQHEVRGAPRRVGPQQHGGTSWRAASRPRTEVTTTMA
eukprot:2325281-Lingulodinium_polyedra.AAC.1